MKDLLPGEGGVVSALELPRERGAALARLGLVPGTEVRCLRRSPLGDPTAYEFRSTVLALRGCDTQHIHLKPKGGPSPL